MFQCKRKCLSMSHVSTTLSSGFFSKKFITDAFYFYTFLLFFLIIMPLSIQSKTNVVYPPLHNAAASGDLQNVKTILENGTSADEPFTIPVEREASPKSCKAPPLRPLELAAAGGHLQVVECLIEHGAKKSIDIAIDNAIRGGHPEVVKYLLKPISDFKKSRYKNSSFLKNACQSGNKEIAGFLLSIGADINHQDNDGNTAIHYVLKNKRSSNELIDTIMKAHPDLSLKNRAGFTAFHYASEEMQLYLSQKYGIH